MVEQPNAILLRRVIEEIWNQGNLAVADLLFAPTYINHAGLIPDLVRGPEAIKISIAMYRTAFPEFQVTIDALTTKRDAVVVRWTAQSPTQQGHLTGILVSRIAGNQISESWMQWDQKGVVQQLGIGPMNR